MSEYGGDCQLTLDFTHQYRIQGEYHVIATVYNHGNHGNYTEVTLQGGDIRAVKRINTVQVGVDLVNVP